MEIKLNQKYFYRDHYIIVKKNQGKYRWLVLNDKNEVIRKSVNEGVTPEETYYDAVSSIDNDTG